ncbi:MAG: hypothetical protein K5864_04810 [Bacteroidales bacterium]|nr:hypothetical protein [Bacteroidales bacterium]
MHLIIDYPWFFVLFCLLAGAAVSALLYYVSFRRRGADARPFGKRVTLLLAAVRFLAVSLIAFLLLAPLVKRQHNITEKPLIVIAHDNSESLALTADSSYYRTDFQKSMDNLASKLRSDFEVVEYVYGDHVALCDEDTMPLFSNKATDMSELLNAIGERYYHRNVGALVLAGDGIYNKGVNPVSQTSSLTFPVYTIALGDTALHRDAAIAHIRCNRIANLGNKFPMDITVNAARMNGEEALLSISNGGKQLFSKQIRYQGDHFSTVEQVLLEATAPGLQRYEVALTPLNDEQSTTNNYRSVPVEVIDGHQKIAIIAAAPHPDVAALRQSITANSNYEVDCFLASESGLEKIGASQSNARQRFVPDDYNMLVFHQLPSKSGAVNADMTTWLKGGVPALFVLGSATDLPRFNAMHTGLEIVSRIDRQNEAMPLFNSNFTLFTLEESVARQLEQCPPLVSPFGDYKSNGNMQTLFFSRVGTVNSGQPLVAMVQLQGGEGAASAQPVRYAFVAGEGLWRWRLSCYQQFGTHEPFDMLVDKLVSFTALRFSKDRFMVEVSNVFSESEPVVLNAQLYNDNYEAVNVPEVSLTVQAMDAEASHEPLRYAFNRSGQGYTLNIGQLVPGLYRYTATTRFNGKDYTASGSFLVEQQLLEELTLRADHSLLQTLATSTDGAMLYPEQIDQLPEMLKNRKDIKSLIYTETTYGDMHNMLLVFLIIVLLLGIEWVVRKYNGTV